MNKQSEQILEEQLVAQLQTMNYQFELIHSEQDLIRNLKQQLEKHNNVIFSEAEFKKVLNILSKGNVFDKAKTLRELKHHIIRDDNTNLYFNFLNTEHWCANQYQVTRQINNEGKYKNRYDVTLLINGLPLVQIELKRRGLELKEAFNQINRYQRHSYGASAALFQYIQLFVISNGVNTKYFANNRKQSFKQTFYWTNKNNERLTNILNGFTSEFLEPCNISKMICKYIVLNETHKQLMVLRPYQYYAVEALVDTVMNSNKNGYIWHTTGSGKTLTSFKASQVLVKLPTVKKVVFCVDRKDLDYQTNKEFDSFKKGCVDATNNTKQLVEQFADPNTKLIVTTIQKLNTALVKSKYSTQMEALKNEKIVFIFDECHRSQFGDTHKRIKAFFNNIQLFGFTGTPILVENAIDNKTTKDLFGECLHKYLITDAIRDENVLKFSVEYVGKYKKKDSATEIDIDVEDIDTDELMEDEKRLTKIANYIIANHSRKTQNQNFSAMFCVSNIATLIKYYDIFYKLKQQEKHNLNIATIFSYGTNENDIDANDSYELEENYDSVDLNVVAEEVITYNTHTREKLDEYISHYNQQYKTNFSTKDSLSFYNYYNDLSKKLKEREKQPEAVENRIDILLVVNMFLTGFDAKKVNTLYVDKNLKQHGLIQAYSRTNRTFNDQKSQGNIVVFRNLKIATDDAIGMYSNPEAKEDIIINPYEDYVKECNQAFLNLLGITPTVNSVNNLQTEEDELKFVQAFRDIIRLKNVLESFADFKWQDLSISEQMFEDYKSKYLDLYDKVKHNNQKEKESILNDVDFEVELIHRDEINVRYIIQLLIKLKLATKNQDKTKDEIAKLLASEIQLRSKKELIEKFIEENLPNIQEGADVPDAFEEFWKTQQKEAFNQLVKEENLNAEKAELLVENYIYSEKEPLMDEVLNLLEGEKPSVLVRSSLAKNIIAKIKAFVETFINGMVA